MHRSILSNFRWAIPFSSGGPGRGPGATYIVKGDSYSLINNNGSDVVLVAGGGGGANGWFGNDGGPASSVSGSSTSGGAQGNSYKSGGGGGLIGNGDGDGYYLNRDTFGLSFKNGARGGDRGGWSSTIVRDAEGGFGGGGGGSAHSGGGGGGYGGGR